MHENRKIFFIGTITCRKVLDKKVLLKMIRNIFIGMTTSREFLDNKCFFKNDQFTLHNKTKMIFYRNKNFYRIFSFQK